MGRLIDADWFRRYVHEQLPDGIFSADEILEMIDDQPTAYDVEKVVEQLEENSHTDYSWCDHVELDKAIEIVRKGGAE